VYNVAAGKKKKKKKKKKGAELENAYLIVVISELGGEIRKGVSRGNAYCDVSFVAAAGSQIMQSERSFVRSFVLFQFSDGVF
jgi:hypothetical protein